MKIKSFLLTALVASALAVGSASANVIVSYGGSNLAMFADTGTGLISNTPLVTYSTTLSNAQGVVTDNSGHVYVADYGNNAVKMYDIASGAFIRDVVSGTYLPVGLAFDPTRPGEIIMMASYGPATQLGRWNTSTTNTVVAYSGGLGNGYAQIGYSPATAAGGPGGTATLEGVFTPVPGASVIQQFSTDNPMVQIGSTWNTTFPLLPPPDDLKGIAPTSITELGGEFYYATGGGKVIRVSDNTAIVFNADNYLGINNDGTSLWVAQYGTSFAAQYSTSGALNKYISLTSPVGIAYTAIPEPSTWLLLALGLTVVVTLRRRRTA